uniref:Uncharacterized protein n=1 Tax=Strombidium inclinatum TaxID=197538 RepID=A0A7S3MX59_9SPIT|mmetsp:Transcript_32290/g.49438  ORF Transcript_32290/g.49438 Transcript_32290/m.49438 type:complete len:120 (+) Transcript_32290:289-648(+)
MNQAIDTSYGFVSPLFVLVFLQCLLSSHLSTQLMLAHVTHSKYDPLLESKLTNLINVVCLALIGMNQWYFSSFASYIEMNKVMLILLAVTVVCHWQYILSVVHEMAIILRIKVFKVKQQ